MRCTYRPWVTSLTLREMRDHLESFAVEPLLLLRERFGAGLHSATVVMPLSVILCRLFLWWLAFLSIWYITESILPQKLSEQCQLCLGNRSKEQLPCHTHNYRCSVSKNLLLGKMNVWDQHPGLTKQTGA